VESIAESRVVTVAIGGMTFDKGIRWVAVFPVNSAGGIPPPRVFFAKSSELHDNKRVEFLTSAKEFGRV